MKPVKVFVGNETTHYNLFNTRLYTAVIWGTGEREKQGKASELNYQCSSRSPLEGSSLDHIGQK